MIFLPLLYILSSIVDVRAQDKEIVVVVICQKNEVSMSRCKTIEDEIKDVDGSVDVLITGRDINHIGDWTIFPIIPMISKKLIDVPNWIFFCTEHTQVDLKQLMSVLEDFNSDEIVFLGRELMDEESTIIHHYASKIDFKFPLMHVGIAISRPLFQSIKIEAYSRDVRKFDFSIDASYELASFIEEIEDDGLLDHSDRFCLEFTPGCATGVRYINKAMVVPADSLYFAVKTCGKFHGDRLKVVKTTWGSVAKNIGYFSDLADPTIPTIALNSPSAPHGHCMKTQAILNHLYKIFKENGTLKWAVIADDDTILSVFRVRELLSDYNPSDLLAIGERYGYNLDDESGYNYLTGGGGVILSRETIFQYRKRSCKCPSSATPDDMFLFGSCLGRLNITLIHSPQFHQARPADYTRDYLKVAPPVSFHKYWMVNPYEVYEEWFNFIGADEVIPTATPHSEL